MATARNMHEALHAALQFTLAEKLQLHRELAKLGSRALRGENLSRG